MPYSMKMALDQTRAALGTAPRPFATGDQTLFPPAPEWAARDELNEVMLWRERLLTRGEVVLSARVMANRTLYSVAATPLSSAMLVAWSRDPYFEEHADELALIARETVALRETSSLEIEENAEIARFIKDEVSRPQNVPLPPGLGEGRNVFLSSLIAWRAHLPFGFLSGTFLPLLVMPGETPAALIVPGRFWSEEFKDR